MDMPSDTLGERMLSALNDLGLRNRTSVHTDRDHTMDGNGDRSVETKTTTIRSEDEELSTTLSNTEYE